MILADNPCFKFDASYNKDNFLVLSRFKRSNVESTEWRVEVFTLSPEIQSKLVSMIVEKEREAHD